MAINTRTLYAGCHGTILLSIADLSCFALTGDPELQRTAEGDLQLLPQEPGFDAIKAFFSWSLRQNELGCLFLARFLGFSEICE
jgi:hypothetical protein